MSDTPAPKMIFINLPVADLKASTAFYEAVGAVRNDNFADESAQAMVLSDVIYVMLLTHDRFSSFTPRRIANAHETAQILICVSENSRADVEATVGRALAAGGKQPNPIQDHGFMYGSNFADPDGHIWEVMWMDPAAISAPQQEPVAA